MGREVAAKDLTAGKWRRIYSSLTGSKVLEFQSSKRPVRTENSILANRARRTSSSENLFFSGRRQM
jgi:hypothetical protein